MLGAAVSLLVSLLTIGGALVAVGQETQKRVDLERRHGELAGEARGRLNLVEGRLGALDVATARAETSLEALRLVVGRIDAGVDAIGAGLRARRDA
jgi:hypothetical protein